MGQKTLSVIMPNYNHAEFIGEAIEAILSQSYKPAEVIVIDDASTDNSVEIIQQFVRKNPIVRLVVNEKNMGVVPNMNKFLLLASGDYVYFAAADDKALPGFFEKSMNLLTKNPDAGLCFSDYVCENDITGVFTENRLNLSDSPCFFSPNEIVNLLRQGYFLISGVNSIIKRAALLEAGSFLPELKWYCDSFVFSITAFRHGTCYIPEPLTFRRISEISYSHTRLGQKSVQREIIKFILDLLKSPDYSDVLPLVKKSRYLSVLGSQLVYVLLTNPNHLDYFNIQSVEKLFIEPLEPVMPQSIKNIYRYITGKKLRKKPVK